MRTRYKRKHNKEESNASTLREGNLPKWKEYAGPRKAATIKSISRLVASVLLSFVFITFESLLSRPQQASVSMLLSAAFAENIDSGWTRNNKYSKSSTDSGSGDKSEYTSKIEMENRKCVSVAELQLRLRLPQLHSDYPNTYFFKYFPRQYKEKIVELVDIICFSSATEVTSSSISSLKSTNPSSSASSSTTASVSSSSSSSSSSSIPAPLSSSQKPNHSIEFLSDGHDWKAIHPFDFGKESILPRWNSKESILTEASYYITENDYEGNLVVNTEQMESKRHRYDHYYPHHGKYSDDTSDGIFRFEPYQDIPENREDKNKTSLFHKSILNRSTTTKPQLFTDNDRGDSRFNPHLHYLNPDSSSNTMYKPLNGHPSLPQYYPIINDYCLPKEREEIIRILSTTPPLDIYDDDNDNENNNNNKDDGSIFELNFYRDIKLSWKMFDDDLHSTTLYPSQTFDAASAYACEKYNYDILSRECFLIHDYIYDNYVKKLPYCTGGYPHSKFHRQKGGEEEEEETERGSHKNSMGSSILLLNPHHSRYFHTNTWIPSWMKKRLLKSFTDESFDQSISYQEVIANNKMYWHVDTSKGMDSNSGNIHINIFLREST